MASDPEEKIELPCPYCGKLNEWDANGNEAPGVFEPYCPTGECEDRHAATL